MPDVSIERRTDAVAVDTVLRRAFYREPGVAPMVEAIRASPQYEPDLALVARLGDDERGDVVGFVMVSHAELVDPADGIGSVRHHDVLTLSPLAVRPDRQGRGIGSALVRAVLARAEARHDLPRLITLEGDPQFYGRLGFEFAGNHGVVFDLPGGHRSPPRRCTGLVGTTRQSVAGSPTRRLSPS